MFHVLGKILKGPGTWHILSVKSAWVQYENVHIPAYSAMMKPLFILEWRDVTNQGENMYRVFDKKVLHKREEKLEEKMKMTYKTSRKIRIWYEVNHIVVFICP